MPELVKNCVVLGGLVLPIFLAGAWRRWGGFVAFFFLVLACVEAVRLQVAPLSTWTIWIDAVPLGPACRMLAWGLLFVLVRRSGGAKGPGSGAFAALLGGLGFGPAAGVALAVGRPGREAARLVLVAVASSLVSPVGNPVAWILGEPAVALALLPLALLLLALSWPRQASTGGSRLLGILALPLWLLGFFLPDLAMAGAVFVAGIEAVRRRRETRLEPGTGLAQAVWAVSAVLGFSLLVLAGVLDALGEGLYGADLVLADALPLVLAAGALVLAAPAMALPVALSAFELRSLEPTLFTFDLRAALAAGAVVGGGLLCLRRAGPGVWRAGLLRWLACAAVTLVFAYFYL
jgi:hypothetical protein